VSKDFRQVQKRLETERIFTVIHAGKYDIVQEQIYLLTFESATQ